MPAFSGARRFSWRCEIAPESRGFLAHASRHPASLAASCGTCGKYAPALPCLQTPCSVGFCGRVCRCAGLHAYFLRHPIALRYLAQKGKGAIMEGLNMGIIKDMPIPLAPIERQAEFARLLDQVIALKAEQRRSAADLEALFASLQHGVFQEEL